MEYRNQSQLPQQVCKIIQITEGDVFIPCLLHIVFVDTDSMI